MGFGNLGVKQAVEQAKGKETPSMATWRVDPAENRKLQTESGVPKSKLLNPKTQKKTGGNKNSSPPSVLRYPNKRLESTTD